MTEEQKILRGLAQLGKPERTTFVATVTDHNPDGDTVDVVDLSGTVFPDVRKRAAIGAPNVGILVTPEQGSTVIVSTIGESDEMFIEMFSAVHSVVFDGGTHGGLAITPTLRDELAKNNQILQAILDVLTGTPITEPGNGSPSALQQSLAGALTGKQVGNFSDIENTKIKH